MIITKQNYLDSLIHTAEKENKLFELLLTIREDEEAKDYVFLKMTTKIGYTPPKKKKKKDEEEQNEVNQTWRGIHP